MSDKTYRLPEVLGGGEVEATEMWGGCAGGRPEYLIGDITVLMPPGLPMDQVTPPLPEEPPVGSVVIVGADPLGLDPLAGYVYRRYRDVWCAPGDHGGLDWARVCMAGTPVRLIPAPVVEPVTLPWTYTAHECVVYVSLPEDGRIGLTFGSNEDDSVGVSLRLNTAHLIGLALLAAERAS